MYKTSITFLLLLLCQTGIAGEMEDTTASEKALFNQHTVNQLYTGKPAKLDLKSDEQASYFRTRLRSALTEGSNFAGHYTLTFWGCGTNCLMGAIMNTTNGQVKAWIDSCGDFAYRPNSKLLIINPYVDENYYPPGCKKQYMLWNGSKLQALKAVIK